MYRVALNFAQSPSENFKSGCRAANQSCLSRAYKVTTTTSSKFKCRSLPRSARKHAMAVQQATEQKPHTNDMAISPSTGPNLNPCPLQQLAKTTSPSIVESASLELIAGGDEGTTESARNPLSAGGSRSRMKSWSGVVVYKHVAENLHINTHSRKCPSQNLTVVHFGVEEYVW